MNLESLTTHIASPLASCPYSNDEYIAPSKAKAISRLVAALCAELRGVATQLVGVKCHFTDVL
jgi:hypothetical protein